MNFFRTYLTKRCLFLNSMVSWYLYQSLRLCSKCYNNLGMGSSFIFRLILKAPCPSAPNFIPNFPDRETYRVDRRACSKNTTSSILIKRESYARSHDHFTFVCINIVNSVDFQSNFWSEIYINCIQA